MRFSVLHPLSKDGILKLRRKVDRRRTMEILALLIFLVISLRTINWFEYPFVIIGGDLRPPLVNQAFVKRVLYTWDETDFGLPSVYPPRILDPLYFFVTAFQTVGLSLYISQMITAFLLYFLSTVLMYIYVKQLTNGDMIAAFVGGLFLTSNVYLIVDREQTALGFIDLALMILPCLVTFTKGVKTKSVKFMAISSILFSLTYGGFPNYRASIIGLISLALTFIYLFIVDEIGIGYKVNKPHRFLYVSLRTDQIFTYLKLLLTFIISLLLVSIWIAAIVMMNSSVLFASYKQAQTPLFVTYLKLHDVLRLIPKWSFYEGWTQGPGKQFFPYVPYWQSYTNNTLIVFLSYVPTLLAFGSLIFKKNKLTVFFGGVAVLSLILTSAFNPFFNQLYLSMTTNIPLLMAFRESTHWVFFVILSFSLLIGVTLSKVCRLFKNSRKSITFALGLTVLLLLSTSYPLITGDVTRNWLEPDIKGSYFPSQYIELNTMLSDRYWSILLPQRLTYVIYNFTKDDSTNGALACGNPYPLIFSKPIISGLGTEYLQPQNPDLINYLYSLILTEIADNSTTDKAQDVPKYLGMLGIEHLILERNLLLGNITEAADIRLNENPNFVLAKSWEEMALFNNTYALEKIYSADTVVNRTTLGDMYGYVVDSNWSSLQHSVLVNLTSANGIVSKSLVQPENLVWDEKSPTNYEVHAHSKGSFVLVFLESYSTQWKLYINGKPLAETNHVVANAYANSWLVDETGDLTLTVVYEAQNTFEISVAASIVLPVILLIFLDRETLKNTGHAIRRRLKRGQSRFV